MPLASKWADDPKLVDRAIEQDKKVHTSKKGEPLTSKWASPVTSEKGKPLASKWATAGTDGDQKEASSLPSRPNIHDRHQGTRREVIQPQHRSPRKENNYQHADGGSRRDLDVSSGLQNLRLGDQAKANNVHKPAASKSLGSKLESPSKPKYEAQNEDQWEDEDDEDDEDEDKEEEAEEVEEVEEDPVAPTKAAQNLASRLGLSLDLPKGPKSYAPKKQQESKEQLRVKRDQDRQSNRNKKVESRTEWDTGKPGTKVDTSRKKEPVARSAPLKPKAREVPTPVVKPLNLEDFVLKPGTNWADISDDDDF